MVRSARVRALLLIVVLCGPVACGCGRRPLPRPRTRDAIFKERQSLPALFITAKTGRHLIAPGDRTMFLDSGTGEVAWRAWACHNPDCPGRGPAGEPFLCIEGDEGYAAKPDGSLGYDPGKSPKLKERPGMCPKCNTIRNPARETPEQARKYEQWVRLHVLPESAARLAELDAEFERRIDYERRRPITRPAD